MLEIVTNGWETPPQIFADPNTAPAPRVCVHQFRANADGCMEHLIDGRLRATVPPEGLADYAATYPDCAAIAAELAAADHR